MKNPKGHYLLVKTADNGLCPDLLRLQAQMTPSYMSFLTTRCYCSSAEQHHQATDTSVQARFTVPLHLCGHVSQTSQVVSSTSDVQISASLCLLPSRKRDSPWQQLAASHITAARFISTCLSRSYIIWQLCRWLKGQKHKRNKEIASWST